MARADQKNVDAKTS